MALSNPFDPPPNTPLVKDASVWAQWSRWFWQIWKRVQTGSLGGTVTSVGLSLPTDVFDVTGSPVTSSGTLTAAFDDQDANKVFAGPTTGAAATPTFRTIDGRDLGVSGSNRVLYIGSGNTISTESAFGYNDSTDLLTVDNITVAGDTTLGDASGDSLTINAGTWTIGNRFTATLAAGTLPAGSNNNLEIFVITATGDSGGTSSAQGVINAFTLEGGNAASSITAYRNIVTHSGSALATNIIGSSHGVFLTGTGSATAGIVVNGTLSISSSGDITTASYFRASVPTLSSTGEVPNLFGFHSQNLGHATLVTTAIGFQGNNMTAAATLTASFRSQQNSGTGVWGYLHTGTANNAFNGNVRIGSTTAPTVALDVTGEAIVSTDFTIGNQLKSINGVTTAGNFGAPATVAVGRSTAQTAAVASVSTFTVGASDGSFEISANVNVTASTVHDFTVTCAYTDETNTTRTLTLGFTQLTGATFLTNITNVTGAGPYESPVYHLRCKAATAITIATTGTFTTVTYNAEGIIKQVN